MIVDPGSLVYRGSLTATHTARAVGSFRRVKAPVPRETCGGGIAGPNGYTRVAPKRIVHYG